MSEYIVDVGTADDEHLKMFGKQAETCFGHPLREEIVRCRDCKWFTPEHTYQEEREYGVYETVTEPPDCGNPERCNTAWDSFTQKMVPVHIVTEPDGFCAWACRKEVDA